MSATTFFLLRHAAHDRVREVLCGRMPGVTLGETGRRQAVALAARLAAEQLNAVFTSPLERAQETAAAIAQRAELPARTTTELAEIDFGDWTGQRFDTLREDPRWHDWNAHRATAQPPNGESMAAVQTRAMAGMDRIREVYGGGRVALVSHGDVIKAILAAVLGLSLDAHDRLEIAPASVSVAVLWDGGGKLLGLNAEPGA